LLIDGSKARMIKKILMGVEEGTQRAVAAKKTAGAVCTFILSVAGFTS